MSDIVMTAGQDAILSIKAIKGWQPDGACIATGDKHVTLAVCCYAAAGLANSDIAYRIRLFGAVADPPSIERYDAALALARHGAFVGASARQIVGWLARLALEVPCWEPDDPAEIASMTCVALREAGR
jgi:hypothetical protein